MCAKCRTIIEKLLDHDQENYDTREEMIAWRIGYLTGILQSIIHDDVTLRLELLKRLKD